jgi:hypothetical protein
MVLFEVVHRKYRSHLIMRQELNGKLCLTLIMFKPEMYDNNVAKRNSNEPKSTYIKM